MVQKQGSSLFVLLFARDHQVDVVGGGSVMTVVFLDGHGLPGWSNDVARSEVL